MSNIYDAYVGVVDESTYGTPVAVTRFYEYTKEGVAGQYDRIESKGMRSGNNVMRTDRFVPNHKGASGDLEFEVLDKGFGFWGKHMFGGTVVTTGPTLGVYKHAFSGGALNGKSFTYQANRIDSAGADNIFTYQGGKVMNWEISNAVDGILMAKFGLDFQKENNGAGAGALAKQSATYTALQRLFTFDGGTVQIGGTTFPVTDISIKADNGLKDDRYSIRTTGLKREPLEEGMRKYTFELKGEFEGITHYNKVASATAAGALASVTAGWTTGAVGGGGIPGLLFTGANARFDVATPTQEAYKLVEMTLSGSFLTDGTLPALKMEYTTEDTTP